jgi:hypothetical protein
MAPVAKETPPPERRTKGSRIMPMHDTGRTQQYLKNETMIFMGFIFSAPFPL